MAAPDVKKGTKAAAKQPPPSSKRATGTGPVGGYPVATKRTFVRRVKVDGIPVAQAAREMKLHQATVTQWLDKRTSARVGPQSRQYPSSVVGTP